MGIIPVQVEGEVVNPQWGLTKANTPRKRLAVACLNCRRKKTKCNPSACCCLQCEKAKRLSGQTSRVPLAKETSNKQLCKSYGSGTRHRQTEFIVGADLLAADISGYSSNQGVHPSTGQGSHDEWRHQSKSVASSANPKETTSMPDRDGSRVYSKIAQRLQPGPFFPQGLTTSFASTEFDKTVPDLYLADPNVLRYLVDLYFSHVNNEILCIFPRDTFMGWLATSADTTLDTLLPLHAMIAVGSVFADGEHAAVGKFFADKATQGSSYNTGCFTLSVVITRLMLSLYNFAKGDEDAAWDYCTLASRAVVALHYDTEEGCLSSHDRQESTIDFGLTTQQLVECRRRTCWTAFLMERYVGFDSNMLCIITTACIHLRLPCAEELYESGVPSTASFFDGGASNLAAVASTTPTLLSPMAWLVVVSSISEHAMRSISRISNYPQSAFHEAYAKTYDGISTALCDWESLLPKHMKYSEANLNHGIQAWYAGTFVSMHTLQQFVLMKLNHQKQQDSVPDLASRNTRTARYHAHHLLEIMCALQSARRDVDHPRPGQPVRFSFSTPFAGYAILLAIEILSTSGPAITPPQTWESISGGLASLRELASLWSSGFRQSRRGEQYLLQHVPLKYSLAYDSSWQ